MTAPRTAILIDPSTAFEALCSLEDRHDLTPAEQALVVALRIALRPALRVTLRRSARRAA